MLSSVANDVLSISFQGKHASRATCQKFYMYTHMFLLDSIK